MLGCREFPTTAALSLTGEGDSATMCPRRGGEAELPACRRPSRPSSLIPLAPARFHRGYPVTLGLCDLQGRPLRSRAGPLLGAGCCPPTPAPLTFAPSGQ